MNSFWDTNYDFSSRFSRKIAFLPLAIEKSEVLSNLNIMLGRNLTITARMLQYL